MAIIQIVIIGYFGISIYQRVMQKNVRNYLIVFCVISVVWVLLRNIKWRAFEGLDLEARFTWYLFYIPMILIPLYGFFIALSMGKEENYKPNKKWNILYVISVLLIGIVLSNDMHQLVFRFHTNFENWDSDYSYGFVYLIVQLFIWLLIVATAFILFQKWRKCNRTKNAYFPLVTIIIGAVYIATYVFQRNIASVIMDVTTFNILIYLLFWESCIQVGMIGSNSKHKIFFECSKVTAQILDKKGDSNLMSLLAEPIEESTFIRLKEKGAITIGNMVLYMKSISNGHVVWSKDISKLNEMNRELIELRDELYGEVAFLEEEKI